MCSWKHGELSLPPSVPSNEGQKRYRVTHLLDDLGWVDWIWDVPQEMSARRWVTLYNIAPKIAFYGRTVHGGIIPGLRTTCLCVCNGLQELWQHKNQEMLPHWTICPDKLYPRLQRSLDGLPLKENLNFLMVDPRDDLVSNDLMQSISIPKV